MPQWAARCKQLLLRVEIYRAACIDRYAPADQEHFGCLISIFANFLLQRFKSLRPIQDQKLFSQTFASLPVRRNDFRSGDPTGDLWFSLKRSEKERSLFGEGEFFGKTKKWVPSFRSLSVLFQFSNGHRDPEIQIEIRTEWKEPLNRRTVLTENDAQWIFTEHFRFSAEFNRVIWWDPIDLLLVFQQKDRKTPSLKLEVPAGYSVPISDWKFFSEKTKTMTTDLDLMESILWNP